VISDLEQALVGLLDSGLPAPFAGSVVAAPPPASVNAPVLVVGVTAATPATPAFGSQLPQQTPAVAGSHRVLRLDCTVTVTALPGPGQGRAQQLDGIQQVLWLLDDPDVRSGTALADGTDRGFVLETLAIGGMTVALEPSAEPPAPPAVTATASGWFWPIGIAGAAGRPIGQVQVRGVTLPVLVSPAQVGGAVGGPPVDITVSVDAASSRITAAGGPSVPLPFTSLVATLSGAGGTAATGALSGGSGGSTTFRTYPMTAGEATVTYQPPTQGASDVLAIALDDGAGGAGVTLGRVPIEVR
jgi:hypothetical protein